MERKAFLSQQQSRKAASQIVFGSSEANRSLAMWYDKDSITLISED